MKGLVWLGTLLAVGAAAERADADTGKGRKAEATEQKRYKGTLREVQAPERFGFLDVKTAKLPDGERVTVSRLVAETPRKGAETEEMLDIHVMIDPDLKVSGDERWVQCQVTHATLKDSDPNDRVGGGEAFDYLCYSSAGEAEASGLQMPSPLGAFEAFAPGDKEYEKNGALPKTEADIALYQLNILYRAYQGLRATGEDKTPMGAYLIKQFRGQIGTAQSHESERLLNEKAIGALKKEWEREAGE